MFKKKKKMIGALEAEDHRKVFSILLERLRDSNGKYDTQAVWVISKLARILSCDDLILKDD